MAYAEQQARISLDADASIGVYTGPPGARGTSGPYWGLQYRFVKVTDAHTAGLCTANTDLSVGVLQNKPQHTGEAASVAISGVTYLQSGDVIAAGDELSADSEGRAVKAAGTGAKTFAIALDAAAAAGQLVPGLLRVNG